MGMEVDLRKFQKLERRIATKLKCWHDGAAFSGLRLGHAGSGLEIHDNLPNG